MNSFSQNDATGNLSDEIDGYNDFESNENTNAVTSGSLLKRKDFLGVDEGASHHPNRTYYYKKQNLNLEEIIDTCSKKLLVRFRRSLDMLRLIKHSRIYFC